MEDSTLEPELRIHCEITPLPIAIESLRACIADADVGAHAWFEGVTRRTTNGRETIELSYEAFEPMASAEMRKLGLAIAKEFGLTALVIVHRLGIVPVGEASLIVGCSSAHRLAVFESLRKVVDQLKHQVPIWKKEHFADGSSEWVHPQ
jgi:molybdopterin synthase catalytic subunit